MHAHNDFVAVSQFVRKIDSRLGTAEADRTLLQYCLNLEFTHHLYVCSFCREFRIQSDTLVDGVGTELKTELDIEDISKAVRLQLALMI